VLTDEAHATFKEMLNYNYKVLTIEDSFEQAEELRIKFEEFATKNGVTIPK